MTDEQKARLQLLERKKYLRPDERGELDHLRWVTSDPVVLRRIDQLQAKPDDPKFPNLQPKRKESPWSRP